MYQSYIIQLTLPQKLRIAVQITQAVAFLHTSDPPLLHMDIKPPNILVGSSVVLSTGSSIYIAKAMHAWIQNYYMSHDFTQMLLLG